MLAEFKKILIFKAKLRFIRTETQKQRVNCHRIHAEENARNQIGTDHDDGHWHSNEIQLNVGLLASEVYVSRGARSQCHQHFGQEEQEIGHLVQCNDT